MKKIGIASGRVLVSLTKQEFKKLAKQNDDDVPDNGDVDSGWIDDLIETVNTNKPLLKKVKKDCEDLAENIGNITDG